jgi:hypothetical protein
MTPKLVLALALVVGGALAGAAFTGVPRAAGAEANAPGCAQWEVMLDALVRTNIDPKTIPAPGKPYVEKAPAGWEPFAFGPTGQLVYRRCIK